MKLPVLAGTRHTRARLNPRKHSANAPYPSAFGRASFVGRHQSKRRSNLSCSRGRMSKGPERSHAQSTLSFSSVPHGGSQSHSFAHAAQVTCVGDQAAKTGRTNAPDDPPSQDPSIRRQDSSPTQDLLNACTSGGAGRIRQAVAASGDAAHAKSKRRKLGCQPTAALAPNCWPNLPADFSTRRNIP